MTSDQERILFNIDMRLRRIETVLIGDKDFKVDGLVDKVDYHGRKIREFKNDKIKVVTFASIVAAIMGFFSVYIHKYFSN